MITCGRELQVPAGFRVRRFGVSPTCSGEPQVGYQLTGELEEDVTFRAFGDVAASVERSLVL